MISLCITNYNRINQVIDSFSDVLNDDRISEILIQDDCSNSESFLSLVELLKKIPNQKICVYRNNTNVSAFVNKYLAVKNAKNDWVILLDSDNKIEKSYIDSIFENKEWDKNTLYMPSRGICNSSLLDYTEFSGKRVSYEEFSKMVEIPKFEVLLNTGNYFFNKHSYTSAFESEDNKHQPFASDVIYMNYIWMKQNKGTIFIVPNLAYHHRLSGDSFWVRNSKKSDDFKFSLLEKIKALQ